MRRRWLVLFFLAFVTVTLSTVMNAQVTTTGSIAVVVEDAQGGRLPGVTVSARAADTVTTRSAVTNTEGIATLEALAPILELQATDPAASTTVRDVDAALDRHVADSLVSLEVAAVRGAGSIADLGSGAGWPGRCSSRRSW